MNQLCSVGFLCGILLAIPLEQTRPQFKPEIPAGYSASSDKLIAQPARQNHPWWVNLGAGPAFVGSRFAMTGGMVYCYQLERSMISARMLGTTNKNPTVQQIDQSSTIYKMADYGILYGPMWQTEYGYASLGAGIGLVRAAYETPVDSTTNTSISLPIEAQWFWRITPYAGLGVYTYAAVNFEKPLYGIMVCAQLGVW